MLRLEGFLVVLGVLLPAALSRTWSQTLPDGPSKELVSQRCSACHGLERVVNAGGTQNGWAERVRRMNRWGARIPEADIQPIAQFLAAHLPPRVRPLTLSSVAFATSVSAVSRHPVQTIVRTSAVRTADGTLAATLSPSADLGLVKPGQRARAFTPSTRFAFQQARVVAVERGGSNVHLSVRLSSGRPEHSRYVLEIVVDHGEFISVPNEAIAEEGERRFVYLRTARGDYVPHEVRVGILGERYTEILAGLHPGDEVVTLGAFFVDAQYRMEAVDP